MCSDARERDAPAESITVSRRVGQPLAQLGRPAPQRGTVPRASTATRSAQSGRPERGVEGRAAGVFHGLENASDTEPLVTVWGYGGAASLADAGYELLLTERQP